MDIAKNQGNVCNIDFLSQLKEMCKLTNDEVVSLQPCIFLVMD